MAAGITIRENGFAEMAFIGSRSNIWHGLGQELTPDSPIEIWITESGCDWTVLESTAFFLDDTGARVNIPDKKVLYRSDVPRALSIVGSEFHVVQPREVIEFFNDLVSDHGMRLSTAGTLWGGTRFWALAETSKETKIAGVDELKGYLLLTTAVDGSLSTTAKLVSTRVVCNNTMQVALNEKGSSLFKQTHRKVWNAHECKLELGLIDSGWDRFITNINTLCDITMSDSQVKKFFEKELYDEKAEEQSKATRDQVDRLMGLYRNGAGAEMGYGTAWGALNAVTNLFTHGTDRRKRDQSKVFWDGYVTNDKIKQVAMQDLLELA